MAEYSMKLQHTANDRRKIKMVGRGIFRPVQKKGLLRFILLIRNLF
jgi:hypothetical protein